MVPYVDRKWNCVVPLMTNDTPALRLAGEPPRRPRADAERNRAHILAIAMQCLADDPSVAFEEIVASSGLGRTTVFRHFASRDELLLAVVGLVAHEFDALLDDVRLEQGTATEALLRLIDAAGELANRLPILLAGKMPSADDIAEAHTAATLMRVARLFERGQATGEFRRDVSSLWLVEAVQALMDAAFRRIGRGGASATDITHLVMPFILGGVVAK
jgi:TetR/AcrR family transcriptional regulator, mexCD-oprJ operon repressor